jgi:hypothetical protein
MTRFVVLLLLCFGCADDEDPSLAAIPCRSDCSSSAATCSNACNGMSSPGSCKTACAANELSCQKVCEERYPADDSIRCKSDCTRFGGTCRNWCMGDSACTINCTNQEQSCKLQCDGQYGGN